MSVLLPPPAALPSCPLLRRLQDQDQEGQREALPQVPCTTAIIRQQATSLVTKPDLSCTWVPTQPGPLVRQSITKSVNPPSRRNSAPSHVTRNLRRRWWWRWRQRRKPLRQGLPHTRTCKAKTLLSNYGRFLSKFPAPMASLKGAGGAGGILHHQKVIVPIAVPQTPPRGNMCILTLRIIVRNTTPAETDFVERCARGKI